MYHCDLVGEAAGAWLTPSLPDYEPGALWFVHKGKPEPQRRPRAAATPYGARVRDDPKNQTYGDRIRWAWRDAGSPDLGAAPIVLVCRFYFARPATHWNSKGQLSAAGLRNPYHTSARDGDLSNLIKAIEDALNGLAWVDDRQVIGYAGSRKAWTQHPQEPARVEVSARALRTDVDWMGT